VELRFLKKSAERFFPEPEERALAEVSDSQGVGGGRDEMRHLGHSGGQRVVPETRPPEPGA
jgi:hypothetical protein